MLNFYEIIEQEVQKESLIIKLIENVKDVEENYMILLLTLDKNYHKMFYNSLLIMENVLIFVLL